jgi:hypothetical protein
VDKGPAGGARVTVERGEGTATLRTPGEHPGDFVRLGAAMASLRAALADLGWASAAEHAEDARRTLVHIGNPVPEGPR